MFNRVNYTPVLALAVTNTSSGFLNDYANEKSRDSGENGPRPATPVDPGELMIETLGSSWYKPEYLPNRLCLACSRSGVGHLHRLGCINEYRSITKVNS